MWALRWHGRGDVRLDDVPAPSQPSPGELLLDVETAGICGTDVEEWLRGPLNIPLTAHPLSGRKAPITLGHETVGVVAAAGAGTTIPVGTRVAVEANTSCGRCWWCCHQRPQLCRTLATKGLSDDGGLAEQMLAPESMCLPVPEHVDAVTAVFCEPLSVAVRAVDLARILHDETALIIGGGTIGQLAAQVARRAGARIVVVEPVGTRRELAARHGASLVTAPDEARDALAAFTDGRGADVCIESSGAAGAVSAASELTRAGGRIVVVGVNTESMGLSPLDVIWREQAILGCLSHTIDDFAAALALLGDGAVHVDGLLTDLVPLSDILHKGLYALRDDPSTQLKIVAAPRPTALPDHPRTAAAGPDTRAEGGVR